MRAVNIYSVSEMPIPRRLFMVLSPRSLPYARLALDSLFRNAEEPLSLTLLTDSDNDKHVLADELNMLAASRRDCLTSRVFSCSDVAALEAEKFAQYQHLRNFRKGHPCWRKITDPILLSAVGQEMIVLDPDIYFPNKFCFEQSLQTGLLLMWQKPSCLLPAEVVETAMNAGILLAHHTDIGVAQWKMPVDLEWLDWLIGKLGSSNLPRSMHVESIVWAALAMRMGGGYLDRRNWLCWHRSQFKRVLRKFGIRGSTILRLEPLSDIKCFHAGGEAKWWMLDAHKCGFLDRNQVHTVQNIPSHYTEFTRNNFASLQRNRQWLKKIGYYELFP